MHIDLQEFWNWVRLILGGAFASFLGLLGYTYRQGQTEMRSRTDKLDVRVVALEEQHTECIERSALATDLLRKEISERLTDIHSQLHSQLHEVRTRQDRILETMMANRNMGK